jgi:hypothetical protein
MTTRSKLIDRCVLGVDVKGYSRQIPRRQRDIQRDLDQELTAAARASGLDRARWHLSHTGDGELAVLPADTDLVAVVGVLVPELNARLAVRNEDRVPEMRIRLRVAVHIDALTPSTGGHLAGNALVVVSRLLDSQPVRDALDGAPGSELALIVSTPVYEKVVLSGLAGLVAGDFVAADADIPGKGFRHAAWVHVPGPPRRAPASDDGSPSRDQDQAQEQVRPSTDRSSRIVIGGDVNTTGPIIGGDVNLG